MFKNQSHVIRNSSFLFDFKAFFVVVEIKCYKIVYQVAFIELLKWELNKAKGIFSWLFF